MFKDKYICGLDIGENVCAVIAKLLPVNKLRAEQMPFEVIGTAMVPSVGTNKGKITDIAGISSVIRKTLKKAQENAGIKKIKMVTTNIKGAHIKYITSNAMVKLSDRGSEITVRQVNRVKEAARTIALPIDREVLMEGALSFMIDGEDGVINPIGLYASRLNGKLYLVTGKSNNIHNIINAVHFAGVEVEELCINIVALSKILLSDREKQNGVILVNIGDGLVEIAVFKSDILYNLQIFDLNKDTDDLDLIKNKLRAFINIAAAGSGVVLSGQKLIEDGFIEKAETVLRANIRMGTVKDMPLSAYDRINYGPAIGLIKYTIDNRISNRKIFKFKPDNFLQRLRELYYEYF